MDAKDTWPVVKFLIAATGFKRRDARKMLQEIPEEHFSRLFVMSRAWDRDTSAKASEQLSQLLGDASIPTLKEATRKAQTPVDPFAGSDDEDDERPIRKKKPAKR